MKTANFTTKQKQTIRIVKQALIDNPKGLTLDEINQKTKLSIPSIQTTLKLLKNEIRFDDVEQLYFWVDNPTTETAEVVNETETNTEIATPKPKNHYKRFSPNKVTGFMLEKAKIRVFLDRRASSHTATLSLDDFEMLAGALGYVKGD